MASRTEISNFALAHLGQDAIINLDDSSKNSRLCARFYEQTRDSLLRSHPWSFAIKRVVLAEEQVQPIFGFSKQFRLPQDCLRVVQVLPTNRPFRIEQNRILSDADVIELRYVHRVEDENQMDIAFIDVLTLALAVNMGYSITLDAEILKILEQRKQDALANARHIQAIENYPPDVLEGDWIPSRY